MSWVDISSHPVDVAQVLDDGSMGPYQRFVVSLTALSVIIDGIDSQLLGIAIPVIMKEWGVARSAFAPILAVGFVGMMAGGAIAGVVGDRLGRRVALIGSVLVFGVMTIGASIVHGLLALGVFRFFVGVGLQGASPNAAALVSEYVPLRHRAFAITATIVCIPAGAMVAGLIAIPVLPALGWRVLFAIGGLIPVVVGIVLIRSLPESPRYLTRYPERWPELSRILERIGFHAPPNATFVDLAERPAARTSFKTLLGPGTSLDTLALWSAFFFCLLAVYSGFNWIPSMLTGAGLPSTVANTGITAYNLGGVIGAMTGAVAIRRFGSKPTMLTIAAAASLVAILMRSMTLAPSSPTLPIILILGIIGALINAVQVTMYALAAHIYPTAVRATGVGVASSVGRTGAILSTYAGAWALEIGGNSSFFALIAGAMFAVFVSLAVIRRHIPGAIGLGRALGAIVGCLLAAHVALARPVAQLRTSATQNKAAAQEDDEIEQLRQAAERGEAMAQFNLGVRYATGKGVAENVELAAQWIRKAADQGDVNAQYNLGLMFADGNGVPQDSARAVVWLRKAADQGDARAQSNLGLMYANGSGVPLDAVEASQWYRKAAVQGEVTAQFSLGLMYANGHGLARDASEAARWFRKAAEQGHALAQFNLGQMYANGVSVPRDATQAFQWFRKAAEQGDATSQFTVAVMYANGTGVARDDVQAVEWYRKAAAQGFAGAETNLGARYADGRGVPQDAAQAVAWFRKAAEQGDTSAAFNLGVMYANGTGILADPIEAYKWIDIAATRASGEQQRRAAGARETLAGALTPEQAAEGQKRARDWNDQHKQ